jgi:hypothetical protein
MAEYQTNPNPNDTDAILGGQNPPPVNAAILGGLAGVKQRLESESIAERLHALNNAVVYGDDGINLALRSLSDNDDKVRRLAKRLLRDRFGEAGKEALLECDLMSYFITLDRWNREEYGYYYGEESSILDPDNTAYYIDVDVPRYWNPSNLSSLNRYDSYETRKLKSLFQDPNAVYLQALILEITDYSYDYFNERIKLNKFNFIFDIFSQENILPRI